MKTYKKIDFYGNFVLIVAIVFLSVIKNEIYYLASFYFVFAIWHIQSLLVHYFYKSFAFAHPKRKTLNKSTFCIVIAFGLFVLALCYLRTTTDFIEGLKLLFLFTLLFSTPIHAIVYIIVCGKEINLMNQRPLHFLK